MNNSGCFVEILNRVGHLANDMSAKIFAEVCQSHDLMEQFATWAKFKNNVVVLLRFREVDQLDDIRMVEIAHDLDLFEDVRSLLNLRVSKGKCKT